MRKEYKLFAILLLSVASLFSAPAMAGGFTAKITSLVFYDGGDLVYIFVEGGTQQKPSCAGSNGDYISFSMTRPRAKEYIAGLLTAFSAGKSVFFRTAGACIDQSVSDTLMYFQIYQ